MKTINMAKEKENACCLWRWIYYLVPHGGYHYVQSKLSLRKPVNSFWRYYTGDRINFDDSTCANIKSTGWSSGINLETISFYALILPQTLTFLPRLTFNMCKFHVMMTIYVALHSPLAPFYNDGRMTQVVEPWIQRLFLTKIRDVTPDIRS